MDKEALLDRAAGLAAGMGASDVSARAGWKLVAQERCGEASRELQASSYAQARTLALAVSDLGLRVTVLDAENRVRLSLWPPQQD